MKRKKNKRRKPAGCWYVVLDMKTKNGYRRVWAEGTHSMKNIERAVLQRF